MSAVVTASAIPDRIVVDASAAIKWFVPEVHADAAQRLLRKDRILLAPDLIWAEVANALWRKWREGELTAEAVQGILRDFRRFPLHIYSGESLYEVAWPVARSSGRTFYDSLYLALAISASCSLVTADARLFHALQGTPWEQHCIWVADVVD